MTLPLIYLILLLICHISIVSTYNSLLQADSDLTMPVAAIESLVSLLAQTPSLSTISETLDVLNTGAMTLKRSVPNSISLSAGTDLFQRYITTTLRRGGPASAAGDFDAIRNHLLSNGRLFVSRAKEARKVIASNARKFIREGSTILTNGGSRVVREVLLAAAEAQTRETGLARFRVIYVVGSPYASQIQNDGQAEGTATIAALRSLHVPVATIPEAAVAYSMGKVSTVLVGAEGVVENGGIISRMGTYQMAVLSRAAGKTFYVVAESHKFVRMFPLGQYDLSVEQNVLDFTTAQSASANATGNPPVAGTTGLLTPKAEQPTGPPESTPSVRESEVEWFSSMDKTPVVKDVTDYFGEDSGIQGPGSSVARKTDTVDYTPPDLISALVTESGVLTPSAVSEELIKLWY